MQKSVAQVNELVCGLRHPDAHLEDLLPNFDLKRENVHLDQLDETSGSTSFKHFQHVSIDISLPSGELHVPHMSMSISDLYICKLTTLIRSTFNTPLAEKYHFSPYRLFHHHDSAEVCIPSGSSNSLPSVPVDMTRVYSELYDSEAMVQEHDRVQCLALHEDDKGCRRECVVLGLMFWSDTTCLANFRTAKLWPIYMFIGNLSKYLHAIPNSGACHHVAYILSLSDRFQDLASSLHKEWSMQRKGILTHCQRQLMHAIWCFILDDDFLHAYHFGMVIMCKDGWHQILEKPVQWACNLIYRQGYSITSARVEDLLKPTSAVPTVNAFVEWLGSDFDLSRMLVVDFMHEFELGIWKALFTHIVRMLYAVDASGCIVGEFDRR
ncbi:hypothetical protein FISHEDRAFT_66447 [Fistulina hepatica ATCC 64428]|uniref:Uncharacterized protein n=1 Tax=Fistulina hepatica ATCC 64428 TaxID=1128425 RepID=A0A0D7A6A7_9AGAR|nr:hypothetical protein FISHEDRAFT_66447 [Fistulina hepatica ATCC 64428]